jgi:hypothetical protein
MKPADVDAKCWAHDMPNEGLARKLFDQMRLAHGNGGVNICTECIKRARASLPPRQS